MIARIFLSVFSLMLCMISITHAANFRVEQVTSELEHPWGMDFLPDGAVVVTEREGNMHLLRDGKLSPVKGLPEIWVSGQGGLLDVAVSSKFQQDQMVYFSFSESNGFLKGHTAVARARLVGNSLENVEVIFRQYPSLSGSRHFGSRILILADNSLVITLGDRGERELAQDPINLIGKLVRIKTDGSIPADNPFVTREGYAPEIYSIGHRNPQGAALDPLGQVWTVSHGARGGDEINRPEPGKNYGWPVISYGRHYTGLKIGEGTEKAGLEQPLFYWDPSIAPSGMTIYSGAMFLEWKGDIFVGALAGQALVRVEAEAGRLSGKEERLLEDELGRIRAVKEAPDGSLWLLTDEDPGGIYRLSR